MGAADTTKYSSDCSRFTSKMTLISPLVPPAVLHRPAGDSPGRTDPHHLVLRLHREGKVTWNLCS